MKTERPVARPNDDVCLDGTEEADVAAATTAESAKSLVAYKGFNANLTCRGFQYEYGKTYEHDGPVVRCAEGGFHSVLMPLDAFSYYGPATSAFALITASGEIDERRDEDTKIASAKITIDAELKLPDFIRRAVQWVIGEAKERVTAGNGAHAASTGNYAHAASTGDYAHAASTGDYAHAASTGCGAHAASTGCGAHAASTGDYAHAASTGDYAHAASTGNYAHAASTGNGAHAASTGDYAHAASTGDYAHAASTGDYAHAASTGYGAISASLGVSGRAKAGVGGAITLAAWDENQWPPKLLAVRSSMVGENGIEPGKSYRLTLAGEFEEVEASHA